MKYFRSGCTMTGTREWITSLLIRLDWWLIVGMHWWKNVYGWCNRTWDKLPQWKNAQKVSISNEISGQLERGRRKRRRNLSPRASRPSCEFSAWGIFEAQSFYIALLTQSLSDQGHKISLPNRYKSQWRCKQNRNSERERQKKGRRNVLHRQWIEITVPLLCHIYHLYRRKLCQVRTGIADWDSCLRITRMLSSVYFDCGAVVQATTFSIKLPPFLVCTSLLIHSEVGDPQSPSPYTI